MINSLPTIVRTHTSQKAVISFSIMRRRIPERELPTFYMEAPRLRPPVVFVVLALYLIAPPIITAQDRAQDVYWIFFRSAHSLDHASTGEVTTRAFERRARRGESSRKTAVAQHYVNKIARLGADVRLQSDLLGAVSAQMTEEVLHKVEALTFVERVVPLRPTRPVIREPAREETPAFKRESSDEAGPSAEVLARINALAPLARGINGRGIILGFLDTQYGGFQHPAFAVHQLEGRILGEEDFVGLTQHNLHGLSVASVAAGRHDGSLLGPGHGASILAATTEYVPTETRAEEEYFVAGLEWLEASGVDVVNISLGYTTFEDFEYDYADLDGATAVTTLAVQRAVELGVVVVTSAGNEGQSDWRYISTPADAPRAITVAAINPDSSRTAFSSVGPTADGRIKPDVAAPGVNVPIATGVSAFGIGRGTSFSAPLVAGVVTQMLQVNGDLTPADVQRILRETSHQSARPDTLLGWGIINADAAIRAAESHRTSTEPALPSFDSEAAITGVFPNPSTHYATFLVSVFAPQVDGRLEILDVTGRHVTTAINGTLGSGHHTLHVFVGSLTPGMYLYRFTGGGAHQHGSFIVIR